LTAGGGDKKEERRADDAGRGYVPDQVVWKARPSIAPYVILYGIAALILAAILVALELYLAGGLLGAAVTTAPLTIGSVSIPYALEVITVVVVFFGYLAKIFGLIILRARERYELRTDGLYINRGIVSLENDFISPMAFSDARLIRTLGMRLVGRSKIIVEANDKRRFEMKLIKDGQTVQGLIRSNLAHPTVRLERQDLIPQAPRAP
jgi:hypothetical protein